MMKGGVVVPSTSVQEEIYERPVRDQGLVWVGCDSALHRGGDVRRDRAQYKLHSRPEFRWEMMCGEVSKGFKVASDLQIKAAINEHLHCSV